MLHDPRHGDGLQQIFAGVLLWLVLFLTSSIGKKTNARIPVVMPRVFATGRCWTAPWLISRSRIASCYVHGSASMCRVDDQELPGLDRVLPAMVR